jgi:hypothetical protein
MDARARQRDDARMPLDLTDLELEPAARACRAMAYRGTARQARAGGRLMISALVLYGTKVAVPIALAALALVIPELGRARGGQKELIDNENRD